jgi:hypothetical protein
MARWKNRDEFKRRVKHWADKHQSKVAGSSAHEKQVGLVLNKRESKL